MHRDSADDLGEPNLVRRYRTWGSLYRCFFHGWERCAYLDYFRVSCLAVCEFFFEVYLLDSRELACCSSHLQLVCVFFGLFWLLLLLLDEDCNPAGGIAVVCLDYVEDMNLAS